MTMELFRKIMDEAAAIPLISQVCLTGLGEPSLDPHLIERIVYARSSKPNAFIDLFTNGVFMTPKLFDRVHAAGLSSIQFSLNATYAEQHEALMGLKDKFTTVCANISYAIRHRGQMRVEVRAVVGPGIWGDDDYDRFYERWGHRDSGGYGQLVTEGNWKGDNRTVHKTFAPNESCSRALSQIYVTHDGKVTTCCFDPSGKQVFGDLKTQTIREVYASPVYQQFREAHFKEEADRYAICAACTRI